MTGQRTVLITGASRGLGRELARQYAAAGWPVIACARAATAPDGEGIEHRQLDVADMGSIAALAAGLGGRPIDLLINNAGIRGDTGGLATIDPDDFLEIMRINALAPLLIVQALLPNLLAGERPIVANISSRAGSLAEGTLDDDDGDYAYRCSKAALNMATVKLAQDLRKHGIAVLSLHPGWVKTDMGGEGARIRVAESATGLKAIIDGVGLADSGSFRAFDGKQVSW
ncbi:NAD(P)-dependent dehydrogenase (short-subunit alcohol dehydrogenase family) [Sinorhizobium terangae]|uniref:SDR family NAD(P)-dependent oxidoreductase n=1 Tax=Sinorhizobium terangae TaxID=110322 RepID=A0A6N7LGZ8_SINTE|nr:SDR family oxidoreductase [Sinorhizobium terangae]MBB4184640.1 NAD(P)-dependent dehydrogenase (short-subunit alcohol dehydrogenase family) [Sinorhizobium terangae]MQX16509.1 SDR family NAD(P)-dependent oxidoreductase [Sinorhizobium terangae]